MSWKGYSHEVGRPVSQAPRAFFYEWMVQQRNASVHTVRSYRDTWRLFLRFVADRQQANGSSTRIGRSYGLRGSAFLNHTEQQRGDTIGTRNCRLSALRSFFGFVAGREPTAIALCTEILHIPTKKAPIHAASYLEPEEVKAILAQPDPSTVEGQRDHALLAFLYNTGARIQEALEVRPQAIRFDSPACVRLYGKGQKERLCPPWPETVLLLRSLLRRQPRADNKPIFVNRYGVPLSASGVRFKLAEYVEDEVRSCQLRLEKHHAPQLPACNCRAPGRGRRRHHGDQKLARARQPQYHQPLCAGQSGDQAQSA